MNMKTITSLIAIIVLFAVGIYLAKDANKRSALEETAETFIEVVNTEEGEIEIETDRPLTESFSNPFSNKKLAREKAAEQKNNYAYRAQKVVTTVVDTITKPFTLGFYYLNNINKKGVEKCTLSDLSREDVSKDIPEYDEDNFTLTDVQFIDSSAYLFVEADESPETICAQIIQFDTITNTLFEAINIIVK